MIEAYALDRTAILDRLGGDEEILTMMLDMYVEDIDSNCAALATAQASGDAAELQREAHTVKGLLATFADRLGVEAALAVELRAKAGEATSQTAAVAALQARMREVAVVLEKELGRPR